MGSRGWEIVFCGGWGCFVLNNYSIVNEGKETKKLERSIPLELPHQIHTISAKKSIIVESLACKPRTFTVLLLTEVQ